jgi:hypothetical protein
MRYILPALVLIVTLVVVSCSKDKVDTKPSINVKSLSTKLVPVNGDLNINLEFRDKEADLESIFVQKIRQNIRKTTTIRDTFSLSVADFPKKTNGEIEMRLFYQLQLISAERAPANPNSSTGFESDSIVIKLALRDKDKHISDTVTTEQIVIQRIN